MKIVGFADDVSLTVIGEMLEEVEMYVMDKIDAIEGWISGVKLQIAHHKTEAQLASNCKVVQQMEVNVGM